MVIFDEIHSVSFVSGGHARKLATANLCGDVDTPATLRRHVVKAMAGEHPAVAREDVETAFDAAFGACEARPGNRSTGTAPLPGGELVIVRSLSGD